MLNPKWSEVTFIDLLSQHWDIVEDNNVGTVSEERKIISSLGKNEKDQI